jgi:hypothetical protein
MAKLYSTKFTHISPVWYDLKSDGNKLVLEGQHNFDAKWVSELQSNGSLVSHLFFFLPLPLCGVRYYYVGVGHITLLQL